MERVREDGYRASDDAERIDRARVWRWLAEDSYWATGRPRDVQDRAIDHSLCVGLYAPDGRQVGFCRLVTDRATFAWLCDVFVDEAHRGNGLGAFMVDFAVSHPALGSVRRQVLITSTAHALYARFGYGPVTDDRLANWMVRLSPG